MSRHTAIFLMYMLPLAIALQLAVLAWNLHRMLRRVRDLVLVGEDLVALLAEGDFARAVSRLNEIGGSLGREVQELLRRLLEEPWVGAGNAVRIAQDQVEPCGSRALGVTACLSILVGTYLSFCSHSFELEGYAICWFGGTALAVVLAMPFCADHFKLRIIRTLHEVQHAAEKWLSEHRGPGERPAKV